MKKIKIYILILLTGISMNSCLVDDDVAQNIETTPYIVGFAQATAVNSYFEDEGVVEKVYPIVLKGSPTGNNYTNDIVLGYTIDPSSTAVEGQEFDFVDTSGSLTLPANSDFTLFPLKLNTGNFNPTEPTTLIINLTGNTEGVTVSEQFKQMTIQFVGCQSQLANYEYEVTIVREDGVVYGPYIETLTEESVNNFLTYSVGRWDPPLNPGHGVRFTDICGTLTIPDQGLADLYSNQVYQSAPSSVDENGNFELNYYISFDTGDLNHKATYIRQ